MQIMPSATDVRKNDVPYSIMDFASKTKNAADKKSNETILINIQFLRLVTASFPLDGIWIPITEHNFRLNKYNLIEPAILSVSTEVMSYYRQLGNPIHFI